ncbi:uncharacterized protein K02A2.6-like [Belonocnema kinseyi]|uniref:uncharacterized protein K02A2.6-like n=1 Tax=Belonocnema kinseyi TaxID=2817044 RepID=UPI00143D183D|nr:uncharacterized protein K02A2.6-like [Belonocnema kinseyi]
MYILDSHSKWPEAFNIPSMSEENTIPIFEGLFVRFRYPSHLVTDNYSTFIVIAFQKLLKAGVLRHSTTPPQFPATNGAAEDFVDRFKRKINSILKDHITLKAAIIKFLFDSRSKLHAATNQSPASLMLGPELKTQFLLFRPPSVKNRIINDQERQICNNLGETKINFSEGDSVVARDYRGKEPSWTPGIFTREIVPGLTFLIKVDGLIWKRHANKLLRRSPVVKDKETG